MGKIKMRLALVISILFTGTVILSSCIMKSPGSELPHITQTEIQSKHTIAPTETSIMEEINHPETNTIILEIPVIEYEDGNQLTEPIITGYDQVVIKQGDEFILDPAALGFIPGKSVGAVQLRLVNIIPDSITVEILADTMFDGKFHPRDPIERIEIKDGTCIDAVPLVMDVFYQYCFDLEGSGPQITLRYRVEGESTMPKP